jgi:hypothetical protein
MKILYVEIMMAHTNLIVLTCLSHLFTTMPVMLFARKAFLPVFELETVSSQRSESDVLESNPQGAAWMYLQADMAF